MIITLSSGFRVFNIFGRSFFKRFGSVWKKKQRHRDSFVAVEGLVVTGAGVFYVCRRASTSVSCATE